MCGNDPQTTLILELGSKFQRLGPESESKQLSLGRKTPIPTVDAPVYHLASGGKGQQDLSVLTPIVWEQSLRILNITGWIHCWWLAPERGLQWFNIGNKSSSHYVSGAEDRLTRGCKGHQTIYVLALFVLEKSPDVFCNRARFQMS